MTNPMSPEEAIQALARVEALLSDWEADGWSESTPTSAREGAAQIRAAITGSAGAIDEQYACCKCNEPIRRTTSGLRWVHMRGTHGHVAHPPLTVKRFGVLN